MGWNVAFQIGASQPSISYQEEELMNTESCIPSNYEIFYDFLVLIECSGLIITQAFGDNAFCNIDENLKI